MSSSVENDVPLDWAAVRRCNVRRALPRHFLYPSLLLLLIEEPRHGYRLVDALLGLGFAVDRPSVYRALADLEGDGLLQSSTEPPTAGSTRHVYSVTAKGTGVLDDWMELVGKQRDCLDLVLSRYLDTSGAGSAHPAAPRRPDGRSGSASAEGRISHPSAVDSQAAPGP